MVKKLWPIEHKPPSFPDNEFPESVNIEVGGEEIEIFSGLPSEDAESVKFSVSSAKTNWDDFIKYTVDQELQLTIRINPTSLD